MMVLNTCSFLFRWSVYAAALMGADLDRLISGARDMERACRDAQVSANPGLTLGAFMVGERAEIETENYFLQAATG